MALEVIGAGWGRTGTFSLMTALNELGYPCHHMHEVFQHPENTSMFTAAARGEPTDWDAVYAGYRAAVDWPTCAFWRELADTYPDAKIVLSTRDPQTWVESYKATIYKPLTDGIPGMDEWNEMVRVVIAGREFENEPHDDAHLMGLFKQHEAEVRETIAPERLLVWSAPDGWDPLCEFLGVDVPSEEFPRLNDRESFGQRNQS